MLDAYMHIALRVNFSLGCIFYRGLQGAMQDFDPLSVVPLLFVYVVAFGTAS